MVSRTLIYERALLDLTLCLIENKGACSEELSIDFVYALSNQNFNIPPPGKPRTFHYFPSPGSGGKAFKGWGIFHLYPGVVGSVSVSLEYGRFANVSVRQALVH